MGNESLMGYPFNAEIRQVTIIREDRSGRVTYYPEKEYHKGRVEDIAQKADRLLYTMIMDSTSIRTARLKARWCARRHNPWKWTGMKVTSVTKTESGGLTDRYRVEVTVNR